MVEYITASQASKILGIAKRTILRWDKSGLLPVSEENREGQLRTRKYPLDKIEKIRDWRNLRKRELKHLRKLDEIQERKNKFLPLTPIDHLHPPRILNIKETEEMKQAYKDLHEWEKELHKIYAEYERFTEDYYRKVPEDEE